MTWTTPRWSAPRRTEPLLERQLGLRVADDLVAALVGLELDHRHLVADLAHAPGDRDLLLELPQAAELHRQPAQPVRAAGGLLGGPGHLGQRPQAVQDPSGQADLLGELRV